MFSQIFSKSLLSKLQADVVNNIDLGVACSVAACSVLHHPELRGVQVMLGVGVDGLWYEEILQHLEKPSSVLRVSKCFLPELELGSSPREEVSSSPG